MTFSVFRPNLKKVMHKCYLDKYRDSYIGKGCECKLLVNTYTTAQMGKDVRTGIY